MTIQIQGSAVKAETNSNKVLRASTYRRSELFCAAGNLAAVGSIGTALIALQLHQTSPIFSVWITRLSFMTTDVLSLGIFPRQGQTIGLRRAAGEYLTYNTEFTRGATQIAVPDGSRLARGGFIGIGSLNSYNSQSPLNMVGNSPQLVGIRQIAHITSLGAFADLTFDLAHSPIRLQNGQVLWAEIMNLANPPTFSGGSDTMNVYSTIEWFETDDEE